MSTLHQNTVWLNTAQLNTLHRKCTTEHSTTWHCITKRCTTKTVKLYNWTLYNWVEKLVRAAGAKQDDIFLQEQFRRVPGSSILSDLSRPARFWTQLTSHLISRPWLDVVLGQMLLLQRQFTPFLHGFSTYNRDLGWGQKWPEVSSNITGNLAKGLSVM